ncbi:hypothetical protein AAF712_004186 [Marasmius tenuissimus]|uniref:beta-glucosidase n=1 Tax=Marasmius tenuissimus TaxID=585030 RepID=A0ABR3A5S4_9AGAR
MADGPAGMRLVKDVTGYPSGINAASTFSKRLMRARGVAMGEEWRAKGSHIYLGPAMDIVSDEIRARVIEVDEVAVIDEEPKDGFGPDPYLTGEASYETIVGVQSVGVQACAKHLVANNQEHWRYGLSADLDDRTLREIYWWPFMRSIEAGVSSVMCAYNRFNQTSSCQNADLLGPNGILIKDGFQGFVMSDWGATHDNAEVNALGGLDMEQPGDWIVIGGGVYGNGLKNAVNNKKVPESRLNEMVTRILASWFRLGQDQDYPPISFNVQKPDGTGPENIPLSVRSDAHTSLAREIAAASTVLLKNDRVTDNGQPTGTTTRGLPLSKSNVKSIAVIGRDAKQLKQDCSGGLNGCNEGTMVIGSNALLLSTETPLLSSIPLDLFLLDGTTTPTSRLSSTPVLPGEQTGPSLVDVLWGAVNPSGRLPFSIADSEEAYGTSIVTGVDGFPTIKYTEGLFIDYRYMDSKGIVPRYEFGYGLSYTKFEYSALSVSSSGTSQAIKFTVKNTGTFDGTEIPQLYLEFPSGAGEPPKVLRGFDEVKLAKGASKEVTLTLSQRDFRYAFRTFWVVTDLM